MLVLTWMSSNMAEGNQLKHVHVVYSKWHSAHGIEIRESVKWSLTRAF